MGQLTLMTGMLAVVLFVSSACCQSSGVQGGETVVYLQPKVVAISEIQSNFSRCCFIFCVLGGLSDDFLLPAATAAEHIVLSDDFLLPAATAAEHIVHPAKQHHERQARSEAAAQCCPQHC